MKTIAISRELLGVVEREYGSILRMLNAMEKVYGLVRSARVGIGGSNTVTYYVTDEQKYLFFLLKYS